MQSLSFILKATSFKTISFLKKCREPSYPHLKFSVRPDSIYPDSFSRSFLSLSMTTFITGSMLPSPLKKLTATLSAPSTTSFMRVGFEQEEIRPMMTRKRVKRNIFILKIRKIRERVRNQQAPRHEMYTSKAPVKGWGILYLIRTLFLQTRLRWH